MQADGYAGRNESFAFAFAGDECGSGDIDCMSPGFVCDHQNDANRWRDLRLL